MRLKHQKNLFRASFLRKKGKAGFIALTSAIIISAILLVATITLSYSSFFARYGILESEYKERSSALAEGCVEVALLKLANDPGLIISVNSEPPITIGGNTCTIYSIENSGSYKIIKTQAIFRNAYTHLMVTVNPDTLAIVSWLETP